MLLIWMFSCDAVAKQWVTSGIKSRFGSREFRKDFSCTHLQGNFVTLHILRIRERAVQPRWKLTVSFGDAREELLCNWDVGVSVRRSGSSRDRNFRHQPGLLPRWSPTQTASACDQCCQLLNWPCHGDRRKITFKCHIINKEHIFHYDRMTNWTPVSQGGLYIFQVFDYYACSGMTLLLFAILQSVSVGWVYGELTNKEDVHLFSVNLWSSIHLHLLTGADRFFGNIEDMIGYKPLPLIKYCLKYVTPVVCMVRNISLINNMSCDTFQRFCFHVCSEGFHFITVCRLCSQTVLLTIFREHLFSL